MKCKHCYKSYKDCTYYKNDKCTYKSLPEKIEDMINNILNVDPEKESKK